MTELPFNLRGFEPRLQHAVESLAVGIAEVAKDLPSAMADDYIESALARFAVQMRRYEGMGLTPAASIGYDVDVWLRKRILIAFRR